MRPAGNLNSFSPCSIRVLLRSSDPLCLPPRELLPRCTMASQRGDGLTGFCGLTSFTLHTLGTQPD
jgi:hypothetical protein